jgi:hypothetical protein
MRAKVKSTGEIVDGNAMVSFNGDDFYLNELEAIIDETEKIYDELDEVYWNRLEHTYAGMAMQGLMTILPNIGGIEGRSPKDEIVDIAIDIAHALVEKLKEKEK